MQIVGRSHALAMVPQYHCTSIWGCHLLRMEGKLHIQEITFGYP